MVRLSWCSLPSCLPAAVPGLASGKQKAQSWDCPGWGQGHGPQGQRGPRGLAGANGGRPSEGTRGAGLGCAAGRGEGCEARSQCFLPAVESAFSLTELMDPKNAMPAFPQTAESAFPSAESAFPRAPTPPALGDGIGHRRRWEEAGGRSWGLALLFVSLLKFTLLY